MAMRCFCPPDSDTPFSPQSCAPGQQQRWRLTTLKPVCDTGAEDCEGRHQHAAKIPVIPPGALLAQNTAQKSSTKARMQAGRLRQQGKFFVACSRKQRTV
jgi:hypothetical protein